MSARSTTKVSRTRTGYRLRVEGRGTLRESPAVHGLIRHLLENEPTCVVLDLAACEYLDSTYLGALIDVHRRFASEPPVRFQVAANEVCRQRLFGPNCLEALFCYAIEEPELVGDEMEIPPLVLGRDDLGRHVLDCHRRLVELGGPNEAAMRGVVERLSAELAVR
jgi:anti-anti-sigma regulatory factor